MISRILVIDDDTSFLLSVKKFLTTAPFSFEVDTTASPLTGLENFKNKNYDCVLLDIKIPAMSGHELLKQFLNISPTVPIIMVSGQSSITMAVDCIQMGAFDYVEKPIDHNRLTVSLMNALKIKQIIQERNAYYEEIRDQFDFIGESEKMVHLKDLINRVANSDITVLITGESGTGKELAAKSIHQKSDRRTNRLITVNCAAISKDLLESELFGFVKGTFTGATETRIGKIQAADRGTLFLDEIGDMSLELQSKILRAIENQEITKIGDNKGSPVDVRFIAATNKDIPYLIGKGLFREDLYYRLQGFEIKLPPLRERKEDIPLLFNHFLSSYCRKHNKPLFKVSNSVCRIIKSHEWFGNIRELKNFIDRLILFTDNQEIGIEQVFLAFDSQLESKGNENPQKVNDYKNHRKEFEKDFLQDALNKNAGNVKKTAEELGIDRSNLYKKLKSLGLIE